TISVESAAPSFSTFACSARSGPAAFSTNVTYAAPRDSASRPSAPEPANRSSTRASARSCWSALIHASRTRSVVGRVRSPGGAAMLWPRHWPAMILTPSLGGAHVHESCLQAFGAVPLVLLELERDVDGRVAEVDVAESFRHTEADRGQSHITLTE